MQQIYSILLVISGERYDAQDALGMLYTVRVIVGAEESVFSLRKGEHPLHHR